MSFPYGGWGELPSLQKGKLKSNDGIAADKVQKYILDEITSMTEQSPASRFRIFRSALGMVIPRLGDFAPIVARILKEYDGFILTSCLQDRVTATPAQCAAMVTAKLASSSVGLKPVERELEEEKAKATDTSSIVSSPPKNGEMRSFNIALLEGRDFVSTEWGVRKDLYLMVSCGKVRHRTQAKGGHLNPVWNEKLIAPVYESSSDLQIDVFDRRVSTRHPMGTCSIDLFQLQFGSHKELDSLLAVHDTTGQCVGSIHVVISEVETKQSHTSMPRLDKRPRVKLSDSEGRASPEKQEKQDKQEREKYICSTCNLEKRVNYLKELRWKETNHELVKNIVELKDYVRVFLLEIERLNEKISALEGERKEVEIQKGSTVIKEQLLQKAHEEFRELERKVRDDLLVLQKRLMTSNSSGSGAFGITADTETQTEPPEETVAFGVVEEQDDTTPNDSVKVQSPAVAAPQIHSSQYVVFIDVSPALQEAIRTPPVASSGVAHHIELLTWGNLYTKAVFSPITDWAGTAYVLPFSEGTDPLGLRALVGFPDVTSALLYGIEVVDRCKKIPPSFLPDRLKKEGFLRVSLEYFSDLETGRGRDNATGRFYLRPSSELSRLVYSNITSLSGSAILGPAALMKDAVEKCSGMLLSRPYARSFIDEQGEHGHKYSYIVSLGFQGELPQIEAREKINLNSQPKVVDFRSVTFQPTAECSCLVIAIEGIQEIEHEVPREACIEAILLYSTRITWMLSRFGGGADMSGDLWEQNGVFAVYFPSAAAASQFALAVQAAFTAYKWPSKLKRCSVTRPLFSELQSMTIPLFNGFRMCMSLAAGNITDALSSVVEVVTLDKVRLFERTLSQIVHCAPGTIVVDDAVRAHTKEEQFFGVWSNCIEWVISEASQQDVQVMVGNAFRRKGSRKDSRRPSKVESAAPQEKLFAMVLYFMNERMNKPEELKTTPIGKVNAELLESGAFSSNTASAGSRQHVLLNQGARQLLNPTFDSLLKMLKRKRLSRDMRRQITRLEQQRLDFEDSSPFGGRAGPGVELQLADITIAVHSLCDQIPPPTEYDSDLEADELKQYKLMFKDDEVGPIKFHQRYLGIKVERKRGKIFKLTAETRDLRAQTERLKGEIDHLRQENAGPLFALHQRIRIFLSMVKQYINQFEDENSPIMSDDEFIEKFIRSLRLNDPEGILGKEKGKLKEDWNELLHVSLENEKMEKQFGLDLPKLLRSSVGMLCKIFLHIRGALREQKRQKKSTAK